MRTLTRLAPILAAFAVAAPSQTPRFSAPRVFSAGTSASYAAAADFNGDGHLDLAISNIGYSGAYGSVSILLGNGRGGFAPAANYSSGLGGGALAVADFNRDGKLDIALANGAVLLGNGDGTFRAGPTFVISAAGDLTTADFNHDGNPDLAVSFSDNGVAILLGNGDGTFGTAQYHRTQSYPGQIVTGDFDGDGKLDIAVVCAGGKDLTASPRSAHGGVTVFLGRGDGTLRKPVHYITGFAPGGLATYDFNGDGKLDLAVADAGFASAPGYVSILPGNGRGGFAKPHRYANGVFGGSIALGDFDGDGKMDLAIGGVGVGTGALWIVPGRGDGTFGRPIAHNVTGDSSLVWELVASALTRSGAPDLVIPEPQTGTVAVLLNRTRK